MPHCSTPVENYYHCAACLPANRCGKREAGAQGKVGDSQVSSDVHSNAAPKARIASMDQIRGYAILGMLLVDYFEAFKVTTEQLHHHRDYMTYADTIAPLFLFVVGMGLRLSMKRRAEHDGVASARRELLKRYVTLVLIAFLLHASSAILTFAGAELEAVPRLAIINSLATYRIDTWRKWLEARIPATAPGRFVYLVVFSVFDGIDEVFVAFIRVFRGLDIRRLFLDFRAVEKIVPEIGVIEIRIRHFTLRGGLRVTSR